MKQDPKSILVKRIHDRELARLAASYCTGRLVDIGCGSKPYRKLLAPWVSQHIGVDRMDSPHGNAHIDLEGTATKIPSPDAYFDSALCTAVLEHLEEPAEALQECYRVLKPNGVAIYSIPFIWHLHEEPRDFYRFTRYGISYLFSKAGFEIVELLPLSGFWVTFGQLFVYNLYRVNRGPLKWLRVVDAAGLLIQGIAYVFDRLDRTEQWTWMYMVVARKPQ